MTLTPGTRLGPYEITAPLGAGGMGEVYRAKDTRLGRDVAIKVLPESFVADASAQQRFEREAKTISGLNHPNICVLYDVGHQDGMEYLVMELVEGETLAKRLERGALPLEQVLKYGAQIAEALDRAHRNGIVHRDLKPGNVMLTPTGAKLVDFGLAKETAGLGSLMTVTSASPLSPLTQQGTIVGTFQYMSPEQVEGKPLDGRSDIFSLGAVLYEMLTGRRAFDGKSQLSVASAILEKEPAPISSIKPASSPILEHVIRRCLAKDPEERWQTARDVQFALGLAEEPQTLPRARAASSLAWIIAAAASILAVAGLWWNLHRPEFEEHPLQFKIERQQGTEFVLGAGGGEALSPNGRTVVYVAASSGGPKLWICPLDSGNARELPGTEGGHFPFWSPDSRSLGFFADGKLQRLDLDGGPATILADAPNARGGTWSSRGVIVFAPSASGTLLKIAATGGPTTRVTTLDSARGENTHRWPLFLPDGRRFLYLVRGDKPGIDGIWTGSLDGPQEKTAIFETSTAIAYSAARGKRPDYLYWVRQASLMAQPFDVQHERLLGDPVSVPGANSISLMPGYGRSSVSVSDNGIILFGTGSDRYQLTWFDRAGKPLATVSQPDRYGSLRISPDGRTIAAVLEDSSGNPDISLLDLTRGIPSRLTFGGAFGTGVWSPDGQRVAYHILYGTKLFVRSAAGAGKEELVLQSQSAIYANDWSPDGRYLVYSQLNSEGRTELWLLPIDGNRQPVPFLKTAFNTLQAQVSPDGKWISYTSDESGRYEIYVQSFPIGGARWRVSNGGGNLARWRKDGRELFYRAPDGELMVASVRTIPAGLEFGIPTALFRISEQQGQQAYPYDVAADGQRILVLVSSQATADSVSLTVLVNWDAKSRP
jgi:Tol biopolymer transport system component